MMKIFILFLLCFMSHMHTSYAGDNTGPMVAQTGAIDISDIAKPTTNSGFSVEMIENQIILKPNQSDVQEISEEKIEHPTSIPDNSTQIAGQIPVSNIQMDKSESIHGILSNSYGTIIFYGLIIWNLLVTLCIGIIFFRYKK